MTLVAAPTFPYPPMFVSPSGASVTLDAAGDGAGIVFKFPKSGTLTHFVCTTGTHTTNGTLSLYLSEVTSAGIPSTTLYAANATGTVTVNASSTILEIPINGGTGVTVAAGDIVASTMYVATGGALRTQIENNADFFPSAGYRPGFPYPISDTASNTGDPSTSTGMSKSGDSRAPVCGLRYSGSDYVQIDQLGLAPTATGNVDFSSSSGDDERGIRFQVPFACRAIGVWQYTQPNGGALAVHRLVNASGTELAVTADFNADQMSGGGNLAMDYFTVPVALDANTEYFVFLAPTSTTAHRLFFQEYTTNALLPLSPTHSGEIYYAFRDSAVPGTITTDDSQSISMGVIIDQLDDGAGGGGGGGATRLVGGVLAS